MTKFDAEVWPADDAALATVQGVFRVMAGPKALLSPEGEVVAITADARTDFHAVLAAMAPQPGPVKIAPRPAGLKDIRIRQVPPGGALAGYRVVEPFTAPHRSLDERRTGVGPATSNLSPDMLHDLRDTLHALSLSLSSASESAGPGGDQGEGLARQLALVAGQIQGLLDRSSRAESFELVSVLEALAETLRPKIAARGARLELDLPAGPIRISSQRSLLLRLVQNLLLNAAGHSQGEAVRLSLTETTAEPGLVGLRIEVADGGTGLPAVLADWLISETAIRPDNGHTGGHGYGLEIVKETARQLGGRMHIEKDSLNRLQFDFSPPRALEAAARPSASQSLEGLRIWLVEDNQIAANLLAEGLRSAGAGVDTFDSAAAALRKRAASAEQPDLLICDFFLGEQTGAGLTRRLREGGFTAPIYGLTGDDSDSTRGLAYAAGMTDVLQKPLPLSALVARIKAGCGPDSMPHRQLLDPEIASELFEDNGVEMTLQFMRRALEQARGIPQLCISAEIPELRGALHSTLGATAITGLLLISDQIKAIQSKVADGAVTADLLLDYTQAIQETEEIMTKIGQSDTFGIPASG